MVDYDFDHNPLHLSMKTHNDFVRSADEVFHCYFNTFDHMSVYTVKAIQLVVDKLKHLSPHLHLYLVPSICDQIDQKAF